MKNHNPIQKHVFFHMSPFGCLMVLGFIFLVVVLIVFTVLQNIG